MILTRHTVHLHMVQLERRHNRHDVDAAEETRERNQQTRPPEQVVVGFCNACDASSPDGDIDHDLHQLYILVHQMYHIHRYLQVLSSQVYTLQALFPDKYWSSAASRVSTTVFLVPYS